MYCNACSPAVKTSVVIIISTEQKKQQLLNMTRESNKMPYLPTFCVMSTQVPNKQDAGNDKAPHIQEVLISEG